MKTLSTLDLRKKLGGILNSVAKDHKHVLITRANKALAVLVPVEEYDEKMQQASRGQRLRELSARLDAWRARHREETAEIDVVRAVRETRDGR